MTTFPTVTTGRRLTAAVTAALLIGMAASGSAVAAPSRPGSPVRAQAVDEALVQPTYPLATRVAAAGPGAAGTRWAVTVGEETHQAPAVEEWDCPTGVWVLQLERDSLDEEDSDTLPLCSTADAKRLTTMLKGLSAEQTVIVNSLNREPHGQTQTLPELGAALAEIGVPKDEFATIDLGDRAFSAYGIPGLPAGQASTATGSLTEEAELVVGSAAEASLGGTLALDNHSNFTLTSTDYTLYRIAPDGVITLDGRAHPVPTRPAGFAGGFHLLVVDRRTLDPLSDTLYATNDDPDEQFRMGNDLKRLAATRGESVLLFLATVGDPLGGRQLPSGPTTFPSPCRPSAAFTVTCTYTPVRPADGGAEQRFVVPDGVTNLRVSLQGGFGGYAKSGGEGGDPARVVADLPVGGDQAVEPGQTLFVEVAGEGTSGGKVPGGLGGWNGGAAGGDSDFSITYGWPGGGGGGASDLRTVSRAGADGNSPASLASRIAVAGGGGGAGGDSIDAGRGGDGGRAGGPGTAGVHRGATAGTGGRGGSTSAGGDAGSGARAVAGQLGNGGNGAFTNDPYGASGGGGGGYYGGGGGGYARAGGGGGGGGGSNLVPAGGRAESVLVHEPARVAISYAVRYGTLAEALRPFGATPTVIDGLRTSPRYALVGTLNSMAGAAAGLSPDSPEASPQISRGSTGELQGVLQPGNRETWHSSITSNAPVVRSLNGKPQPPTVLNYGLYDVVAHVSRPWPVPAAGPRHDPQQRALTYLSRALCACDDLRVRYNASQSVIKTYQDELAATPYPAGEDFTAADFAAVRDQLLLELSYVFVVSGLEGGVHTMLGDQQHMLQPALQAAYREVQESVKVRDDTKMGVAIVRFILEMFTIVAEEAKAAPIAAALGIANAALSLSTELTNEEDGGDSDVLTTTAGKLGDQTAANFGAALSSLSQTFGYVYADWGKLSAVGNGLLKDEPSWDIKPSEAAQHATAVADAGKLSFYRALVGLSYQRFEAQAAPTAALANWCVFVVPGPGCTSAAKAGFAYPSSAYPTAVHAPALDFRPASDNVLVTVNTSTTKSAVKPLPPGLMKELQESGLYPPYLFLRWSLVRGLTCPVDYRAQLNGGGTSTPSGTPFVCAGSGVGSGAPSPEPTATEPTATEPTATSSPRPGDPTTGPSAAPTRGGTEPGPRSSAAPGGSGSNRSGELASTGGPGLVILVVAAALLLAGAAFLTTARRGRPRRPR